MDILLSKVSSLSSDKFSLGFNNFRVKFFALLDKRIILIPSPFHTSFDSFDVPPFQMFSHE